MRLALSIIIVAVLLAAPASAGPVDAHTLDLSTLQGEFDKIGSSIDANADEHPGYESYQFQSFIAGTTYVATATFSGDIALGLYDIYDLSNQLTLFDTTAATSNSPGDPTHIGWDGAGGVTAFNFDGGFNLLGTMTLTSGSFGIFVTTSEGTFYSESAANPGGADHFLSYEGAGDKVTFPGPVTFISDIGHHYIAAEAGDDSDFADIVVQFESIHPNPEPGTLALVGTTCLIGAGIRARRRRKKAQAAA